MRLFTIIVLFCLSGCSLLGLEEEDSVSSDIATISDESSDYTPIVIKDFKIMDYYYDNFTHIREYPFPSGKRSGFETEIYFYHLETNHDECVDDYDVFVEWKPNFPFRSFRTVCRASDQNQPIGPDNTVWYSTLFILDNYSHYITAPTEVTFEVKVSEALTLSSPRSSKPTSYTITFLPE